MAQDYTTCENSSLSWEALYRLLIFVSSDGCATVNIIKNTSGPSLSSKELREDGSIELREDLGIELREA